MTRALITIDGIDGSGKSTFARRLLAALAEAGTPGVLISVDDFRRPVDWSACASRAAEVEAYYHDYYDLEHCERCLAAFTAGEPAATVPRFDPVTERPLAPRSIAFAGAAVAVIEGVFPLRLPSVARGLLIYLEVGAAEARRRIIERDLKKGRTRDEIERRIDHRYSRGQDRYHLAHDPRHHADVIVDNNRPGEPVVLRRELARADPALRDALARALP